MASVNKVILVGALGADPEVRSFQNGGQVCNLRIATSETWKDKNSGDKKEKTEWHTVAIFSEGLVSVAQRFLKKGSKVYIEGKLATRKWQDAQGADRYSTEIVLQGFDAKLVMLDGPSAGQGERQGGFDGGTQSSTRGNGGNSSGGFGRGAAFDDLDDEHVPFVSSDIRMEHRAR